MKNTAAAITGLRMPQPLLTYHGRTGKVTLNSDPPKADCYYCKALRGTRDRADIFSMFLDTGFR